MTEKKLAMNLEIATQFAMRQERVEPGIVLALTLCALQVFAGG